MLANGLHRIRWRRVAVERVHRTAACQFARDFVYKQQSIVVRGVENVGKRTPSDPKRGRAFTCLKENKNVGTEPFFIGSVPSPPMDLFRNGTDKTGMGQVPFTRQILSEPFVFLSEPFQFFRSCKRPLKNEVYSCVACLFRFMD